MLANGTRVTTPDGEGTIKSSTAGFKGTYYTVEFDNGKRDIYLDADVKEV